VGLAAAAILQQPAAGLAPFLAARRLEVKGASRANFADVAAELSAAVGYPIALNPIPRGAFVATLQSFGVPRVFATSFLETYEQCDGVLPAGYESYGPAHLSKWDKPSAPELVAIGWKARSLKEWASDPATVAHFAK
jgi:hypothetical protein